MIRSIVELLSTLLSLIEKLWKMAQEKELAKFVKSLETAIDNLQKAKSDAEKLEAAKALSRLAGGS